MPLAVFGLVFASLCAYECTAAPWVTFLAAPVVAVTWGIGLAIRYLGHAARLPEGEAAGLRRFVWWSALWGPLVAALLFYAAVYVMTLL